jgi:hypothetical protein
LGVSQRLACDPVVTVDSFEEDGVQADVEVHVLNSAAIHSAGLVGGDVDIGNTVLRIGRIQPACDEHITPHDGRTRNTVEVPRPPHRREIFAAVEMDVASPHDRRGSQWPLDEVVKGAVIHHDYLGPLEPKCSKLLWTCNEELGVPDDEIHRIARRFPDQ